MLPNTDPLLSEKFFLSLDSSPELHKAFQDEKNALSARIKTELYPAYEKAIYYLGKHLDRKALDGFVNSENYKLLQDQFKIIIKKMQQWGESHALVERNNLDDFLIKLQNPTEKMTLLYADGKRSLETLAVLLINDQIPLDLRKLVYIQLLADNELSKCIDGCYTRIVSCMRQLELYRQSPNQINRWIRAYTTQVANEIAAQRPFAMPESYQVLVCRTLDISVAANELHASNYLLIKAKENEFPVDGINDIGALEIKHKMETLNRDQLAKLYLDDLAEAVTITGLVHYISMRLHDDFSQIISDPIRDYSEKINAIEGRLKLIGSDPGFLLGEILEDEPFGLKTVGYLKITTERRLSQQDWFKPIQPGELNISNKIYTYYNFPGNIELNWFSIAGDTTRYLFIDLIRNTDTGLSTDLKFQLLASLFRQPDYISHAKDLNALLDKSFLSFSLTRIISSQHIITLLKKEINSLLFVNVISRLDKTEGSQIIKALGQEYISDTITEGYLKSKVKRNFYWLKDSYFLQYYDEIAIKEGLQVTQQLFLQVIERDYRDFNKFIFHQLKYLDYLKGIDFSGCELKKALFLQRVTACTFDQANLKDAQFDNRVTDSSFRKVDLRDTTFFPPINNQNSDLSLKTTILSTKVFQELMNSGIHDFSGADLTHVDLHIVLFKKNSYLDFSGANLKNAFLSEIDFSHINLQGSNLENTNLINSFFNIDYLDNTISTRGATLSKYTAHKLFVAGVRQFDDCKIVEQQITLFENFIKFSGASFRRASFIGYTYDIEFTDCDLREAYFKVASEFPIEGGEPGFVFNTKFKDSQLEKITFQNVKIKEPLEVSNSPAKGGVLDNIEMSTSMLFKLYVNGILDFSGVKKSIEEKIPDKLPPFPLLGATLPKEMFIQLYRQGIRDFRSSNLHGFYLGKALEEEAISEIELKLEGARYQQLPLSCGSSRSSSPHKRNAPVCNVYFLIQKIDSKKMISWWDLKDLEIVIPDKNSLLKEVNLGITPLYILDNPTNLHLYWGYEPNSESLTKVIDFLQKSTQIAQRDIVRIYFYFDKIKTDDLQLLAQNTRNLGFINGQLIYSNEKNQQMIFDLKQKSATEITVKTNKLSELNDKIKLSVKPALPNKNWRTQLKSSITNMRMHAKDQGLQYDAFLVLLDVIATWIKQSDTTERKKLTIDGKLELQDYASQLVDQEALNHGANDRQHSLTFNIAKQCIERGECHNRELVRENILNTLQTLRPDTVIGFEELGKKIKSGFESIGSYFTSRFDDFFKKFSILLYLNEASIKANQSQKAKRKSLNWYSQPQIVYFIKMIEYAFWDLGFDLNLDPNYSESLLVGYLYDIYQALKKQGVSSQTPRNLTLALLENEQFIQSTLDGTYLSQNKIVLQSNQGNATSTDLSIPITPAKEILSAKTTQQTHRNKRSLAEHQEQYIDEDAMEDIDEKAIAFLATRDRKQIREQKKRDYTQHTVTSHHKKLSSRQHENVSQEIIEKPISITPNPIKSNTKQHINQTDGKKRAAAEHQKLLCKRNDRQLEEKEKIENPKSQKTKRESEKNLQQIAKNSTKQYNNQSSIEHINHQQHRLQFTNTHSYPLLFINPPTPKTGKGPINQVTASPDLIGTVMLLKYFKKVNYKKTTAFANFEKTALIKRNIRSMIREGNGVLPISPSQRKR